MTGPAAVEDLAFAAAGEWALAAIRMASDIKSRGFEAAEKGAIFDMITPADGLIERYLRDQVARQFPDHAFLGEEQGGVHERSGFLWVVDPIDGTLNYSTGLAGAACSIALLKDGEPVIGAIGDFTSGLAYRAISGTGAILCHDGKMESRRLPTWSTVGSERVFLEWGWEDLDAVMIGTIAALRGTRPRFIRLVGGAAYALLHAALYGGSMLGIGLRIWDVAAGIVIAREAGLEVRLWQEGASVHVIAGSEQDVRELAPIVERFGSSRVAAIA